VAIPTSYAPVYPQDFVLTPLKVYKTHVIKGSDLHTTASGYKLVEGQYKSKPTPIGTYEAENDPINIVDNSYKHIIWKHVDLMFYRNPNDKFKTFEHYNPRFTYKNLNISCSLLSIPYMDYGEKISKGSLTISGSGFNIKDDGYGNIYDVDLNTRISESFYLDKKRLIGYFGFDNLYRNFKYGYGFIENGESRYESSIFTPDSTYKLKNVHLGDPLYITSSGEINGLSAEFINGGYVQIHNRPEFNFDSSDEFTISCWIYPYSYSSGSIISKRGTVFLNKYGVQNRVVNSLILKDKYISSSYVNVTTDIYPYDLSYNNNTLSFKRSDGIDNINITGSLVTGSWNHVSLVRSISGDQGLCSMYINNQLISTVIDTTRNPINDYDIILGSMNINCDEYYNGRIDEVKFYNTSFIKNQDYTSSNVIHKNLYNLDAIHGTGIIGNIFYRTGNIVISPKLKRYENIINDNSIIKYKGTHTIYENSCLVRIKKGDFNLSQNITARKSPKSDQLINEMTGSLLSPYFTTIGLYNDKGDLLVIAKMGQPVQVRSDVDINILVKWDI
jgi:hypothetical protein